MANNDSDNRQDPSSSQSSSKQASQSGQSGQSGKTGQSSQSSQSGESGKRRVIGEGMTSLDSTQAPLKAETGEPDWDAMDGSIPRDADQK